MAIRAVTFTVNNNMSVSPSATQYGGVQGEHNATEVVFTYGADSPLTNPQLTMYIEVMTSVGGYDKTNTLQPENNTLHTLVPLAWTQYGAVTTLRLVAELDGAVAFTAEGKIRFDERQTAMEKVDGLLRTSIGEAVAVCERVEKLDPIKAAANANDAADKANDAAENANAAKREITEGGYIAAIKETNRGDKFHVWVGTEEEYDELPEEPKNTLCIVGGDDIADYVVEQGVSDGWTYRKWASGIAECWGRFSRVISWSGGGPVYYSTTIKYLNFPQNLFVNTPIVTTGFNNASAYVISTLGDITTTYAAERYCRIMGGSEDISGVISAKAVGRWK